ncbi:MAG: DnaD domain protein [Bacilli bacterium]|nr:DnaD domain protein [Bacilli bacterium]
MSQYYSLLKNGKIDFSESLLEKYTLIGLDEIDCVLLIKVHKVLKDNNNANEVNIVNILSEEMSLNEKEISDKLVQLINSSYISIDEENQRFSLDGTYKRLASLYGSEQEQNDKDENINDLRKAAAFIEKECEHLLSPTELEVIKHWIEVDKFSLSEIKEATLDAISHKKKNVKYIDAFLNKQKTKQENKQEYDNELSALFEAAVYGKKRS